MTRIPSRSFPLLVSLCTMGLSMPAAAQGTVANWRAGDGNWEDTTRWGGVPPAPTSVAAINGTSRVTLRTTDAAVSRLDLGTARNADASLTMHGGSLAAVEFIRIAEGAGSHGQFILRGGRVCATQVAVGGLNEAEAACRAELEVHGGSLLTRYLSLGWRSGSTAQLRVVGSKAEGIVALNWVDCAIPAGALGSTCTLRFDLDGAGVTPIVLGNKRGSVVLARKGRAGKCLLRVGLVDAPPDGDIPLVHSHQPCRGTFHELPEGSRIRADHAGNTYDWRLTYRRGATGCDIVLTDPQVGIGGGPPVAYRTGKAARRFAVEPAAIRAAWDGLYREVDRAAPPLGSGTRAFPGAEGYGAFSKGGRGGTVLFVTNLEDSGPGSLRAAIDAKGPRTVLFRVGGTIHLKTPLRIREPFLTIAGQTAPGDGICLRGSQDTLTLLNTHDVIVRHLRVRTGYQGEQDKDEGDCISCYNSQNFILDHCSTSWGTDETISCTQTCDRYTVQWCLIAEGLNYHGHSMGSILGGDRSTWHHNLFAHCRTRNPRFAGLCRCDFRNNVLYDWGDTCSYGDFRILGEFPVRKFNSSPHAPPEGARHAERDGYNGQPLDPDGNPDTSFLAKIPADVAWTFQTLDKHGMVLNMAQTWHQLRPGEVRTDCGGCHAHSQRPTPFKDTFAARPDYTPFDLTKRTPLLTSKPNDQSGQQWDVDDTTGLRHVPGVVNVEYHRDIRPILERSCVACHSGKSAKPAGGLVLDDDTIRDGRLGTYSALLRAKDRNTEPYVWPFRSRNSPLVRPQE